MTVLLRIAAVLWGYAMGLIQTAYIYGKLNGIDIRAHGSGNAGTTNALRTLGKKAGAIVMTGDLLKCIVAVLIARLILGRFAPDMVWVLGAWTALGCIAGHNYPFYMNFRGGKGVACTAGYIIASFAVMIPIGLLVFFGTVAVTHYVSLASLLLGAALMIGTVVMGQLGMLGSSVPLRIELYILTAVMVAEMYYRHRENIRRLLSGTERRTYIIRKGEDR